MRIVTHHTLTLVHGRHHHFDNLFVNLLFAAVDAVFGDLRWLSAYDAIKIEQPDNYFRNKPRPVWWNNRGPLCADGLVLVTPNDSLKVFAFEPSSGKLRWDFSLKQRRPWPSSGATCKPSSRST